MGFFGPDYLAGSEVIKPRELVDCLFDTLGDTIRAPNGAHFTRAHILASQPDRQVKILKIKLQDKWVSKHSRTTRWYPWTAEVGDCDSRTHLFGADMIERAIVAGWKEGLALVDLWYVSKSLAKEPDNPWSGYHSAPALFYRDEGSGLLRFRIRQPKAFNYAGEWQKPADEVRDWVNAVGIS